MTQARFRVGDTVRLTPEGRRFFVRGRAQRRTIATVLNKSRFMDSYRVEWERLATPEVLHQDFIESVDLNAEHTTGGRMGEQDDAWFEEHLDTLIRDALYRGMDRKSIEHLLEEALKESLTPETAREGERRR